MRASISTSALIACLIGACAGDPAVPPSPILPKRARPRPGLPITCPARVDARELLDRHEHNFGSSTALAAELPRTFRFDVETEGQRGVAELVLDRAGHRSMASIGGVFAASGVDSQGPWVLGPSAVLTRLRSDEATNIAFESWVERRLYVKGFDVKRDAAECQRDDHGRPLIVLTYHDPQIGEPELVFDFADAELFAFSAAGADGRRSGTHVEAWSRAAQDGVRWPTTSTETELVANPTTIRTVSMRPGFACAPIDAQVKGATDCLAPPTPRLNFKWPGGAPVRVPMKYLLHEILISVKLGGRVTWALLDSGAGLTVIDATTPAASSFRSTIQMTGQSATQKIRVGLGEVPELSIGELTLEHLPVASVPIPALDAYGDARPEVVVGYSVFEGAAIRVDYENKQVTFGPAALPLRSPRAVAVPFRVLDGKWGASAELDGTPALLQIDTGNSGAFVLAKAWAKPHGFPGTRRFISVTGLTSAGTEATESTVFRLERGALGPITVENSIASIDDPPDAGALAGLLGNDVLSRCRAVTFDLSARALWLEVPCDRPVSESLAGWVLLRDKSDAKKPGWVVERVTPAGSAERAGVRAEDRLIRVAGHPGATIDLEGLERIASQRAGTKIPLTIERKGKSQAIVMELKPLLFP